MHRAGGETAGRQSRGGGGERQARRVGLRLANSKRSRTLQHDVEPAIGPVKCGKAWWWWWVLAGARYRFLFPPPSSNTC